MKSIKAFSLIIILALLSTEMLLAQSKKQMIEIRKEALEYYAEHDFGRALPLFEQLNRYEPEQTITMYPLAVCLLDYDKGRSLNFFRKCLKDSLELPDRLFAYCGEAYHRHHQMDSALIYFNKFYDKLKSKKQNRAIKNEIYDVQRQIKSCEVGLELMANKIDLKIENLGGAMNSKYDEYAPVLSVDENVLIFTSARPKQVGSNEHYDEDLFICYRNDHGEWTDAIRMGGNVNTLDHDASISLSSDGQKLLLYRYAHDNLLHSSGDIFISELKGKEWTVAEKVHSHVNSSSWESSASISADENAIYFTSDRKGGLGGTDIYRVKKLSSGLWADPENLGDIINTPFDEESPFIHPDGKTLYFSSNGHRTMGGYDIFRSNYVDSTNTWSEPVNIGYPINTAHDDLHFQLSADGKRIYFASVRPESYGGMDIYTANVQEDKANLVVIKGTIVDEESHLALEAEIKTVNEETGEMLGLFHSNSETGRYLLVVNHDMIVKIEISAEGYEPYFFTLTGGDEGAFVEKIENIGLRSVHKP